MKGKKKMGNLEEIFGTGGFIPANVPDYDELEAMNKQAMKDNPPPWGKKKPEDIPTAEEFPEGLGVEAQLLKVRIFDADKPIKEPAPAFKIADKTVMTPGNFSTVASQSKTGKTAYIGGMLAALIAGPEGEGDTLGWSANNADGKAVIHIDTEQSLYHHHRGILRVLHRAEVKRPPDWFRSYCLTGLGAAELEKTIWEALRIGDKECGGIHSIVIDGYADLVEDVNDAGPCNQIVAKLHAAAIHYNCHICGIIHFNPGTNKVRGHLGSQFERKGEIILYLEKAGDVTKVTSGVARNAPVSKSDGVCFAWDDDMKMHMSVGSGVMLRSDPKWQEELDFARSVFREIGVTTATFRAVAAKIEEITKTKYDTARVRLWRLKKKGIIIEVDGGYLTLVDPDSL